MKGPKYAYSSNMLMNATYNWFVFQDHIPPLMAPVSQKAACFVQK